MRRRPPREKPMPPKPPYVVPTMTGVAGARGTAGLKVASLFAGCGGTGIGFELAGFEVVYANEFVDAAADTHDANFPVTADRRDIRTVSPEDIPQCDVLEGSPPCAPFSLVGKREATWTEDRPYSDTHQRTDDLFDHYCRILEAVRPKIFIAENVPGMARGKAVGLARETMERMQRAGYVVENRVLNALWLGVPQRRERLWFAGVRDDVAATHGTFPWPEPNYYAYSVAEALEGLDPQVEPEAWIDAQAIGKEWRRLEVGVWSKRYMNLIRVRLDGPCPAVTQRAGYGGVAGITRPDEPRKFSIAELKRLCAFPDDFELTGSYGQRWERLGRSVPPPVARSLAAGIARYL